MQLQNLANMSWEGNWPRVSCWLSVSGEILSPKHCGKTFYPSNPVSFLSVAFWSSWLIAWLFSLSSSLKLCPSKVLSLFSHNIKFNIGKNLRERPTACLLQSLSLEGIYLLSIIKWKTLFCLSGPVLQALSYSNIQQISMVFSVFFRFKSGTLTPMVFKNSPGFSLSQWSAYAKNRVTMTRIGKWLKE